MGLFSGIQTLAIKILFSNKEKMLSIFLSQLDKEYKNDRTKIAQAVIDHLPDSWKKTATPDELAEAMDLTKKYVEDMYVLIQKMRSL